MSNYINPVGYVTEHAIEQYSARMCQGSNKISEVIHVNKKEDHLRRAVCFGIKLKPEHTLKKLLRHKCKPAEYFLYRGTVAVLVDRRIVTAYKYNPEHFTVAPSDKQE